jgi:hypothetical protein
MACSLAAAMEFSTVQVFLVLARRGFCVTISAFARDWKLRLLGVL